MVVTGSSFSRSATDAAYSHSPSIAHSNFLTGKYSLTIKRLDEVSAISLGFPHDFLAAPPSQDRIAAGSARFSTDAQRTCDLLFGMTNDRDLSRDLKNQAYHAANVANASRGSPVGKRSQSNAPSRLI
jgi:hypothetical protein